MIIYCNLGTTILQVINKSLDYYHIIVPHLFIILVKNRANINKCFGRLTILDFPNYFPNYMIIIAIISRTCC